MKKLLLVTSCLIAFATITNAAVKINKVSKTETIAKKNQMVTSLGKKQNSLTAKLLVEIVILVFSEQCEDGSTWVQVCVNVFDQGGFGYGCTTLSPECPITPPAQ